MVSEEELCGSSFGFAVTLFLAHYPKPQPQGSALHRPSALKAGANSPCEMGTGAISTRLEMLPSIFTSLSAPRTSPGAGMQPAARPNGCWLQLP